ncbi:hypothetical protein GAPWKB30_0541 [Gilliamella apicola]|nr:hypothetical protein GAPWKB30_0541 [Gilliamella apicola]
MEKDFIPILENATYNQNGIFIFSFCFTNLNLVFVSVFIPD